jgi:hypothetical protein
VRDSVVEQQPWDAEARSEYSQAPTVSPALELGAELAGHHSRCLRKWRRGEYGRVWQVGREHARETAWRIAQQQALPGAGHGAPAVQLRGRADGRGDRLSMETHSTDNPLRSAPARSPLTTERQSFDVDSSPTETRDGSSHSETVKNGPHNKRSRGRRKRKVTAHRAALDEPSAKSVAAGDHGRKPQYVPSDIHPPPMLNRIGRAVTDPQAHKRFATHFSIREPTEAELSRAHVTRKQFEHVKDSEEVQRLIDKFGEAHVPSSNMIMHIAANQFSLDNSVQPEMFTLPEVASEDTGESSASFFTKAGEGPGGVGYQMFAKTYSDIDMPWDLMTAELNVHARRRIAYSCHMIDPDSVFRQGWDFVQVFLLIWLTIQLPYEIAFPVRTLSSVLLLVACYPKSS